PTTLGGCLLVPNAFKGKPNTVMLECEDCGGEERGVLRAVDRDAGDGNARRHLRDRQERIEAGGCVAPRGDGNTYHRQRSHGGDDAREVRSHSGGGDDDLEAVAGG